MRFLRTLATSSLLMAALSGCGDFTSEVEVDLPTPPAQLVIESYLEPDSAFRVSVTQTLPFFGATAQVPIVQNATVTITYGNTIVPLSFSPIGNPNNRFAFGEYRSAPGVVVPRDFTTLFLLRVSDPSGRVATSQTTITPPVAQIDTVEFQYTNNNRDVSVQMYWPDPAEGVENYYRITYDFGEPDSILSIERTDFARTGPTDFTFTPPNFRPGQQLVIRHMHISKAYYDFYQSVERAQRGNINPFQEPGRIFDNVDGGIGIFTGLVVTQKRVTIPIPD